MYSSIYYIYVCFIMSFSLMDLCPCGDIVSQDEIQHTMPATLRRAKEQGLVLYQGTLLIQVNAHCVLARTSLHYHHLFLLCSVMTWIRSPVVYAFV